MSIIYGNMVGGASGTDGKSAYQYAVEGGYTGTETEFAKKLASEALIVTITDNNGTLSADKTFLETYDAFLAGIPVYAIYDGSSPLPVKIPSAVTDDHINFLIDTKLGVIENGSY